MLVQNDSGQRNVLAEIYHNNETRTNVAQSNDLKTMAD